MFLEDNKHGSAMCPINRNKGILKLNKIWGYLYNLILICGISYLATPAAVGKSHPRSDGNVGILKNRWLSLTSGMKEKLHSNISDSLTWASSDTSVVSLVNSVVTARSVGNASVYVSNIAGDLHDTCTVTVVPWIASITDLSPGLVFPNMRLLSMKDDTLYMQGTGGGNGWSEVYFYKKGMTSPRLLGNFPSTVSSGTDAEPFLATSFGNFILAKRESVDSPRKIYQLFPETQTNALVYDSFPPIPAHPNYSYVMRQGWDYDNFGNIYMGEYNINPVDNYQIKIFKGSNFGKSWDPVYTFPPRDSGGNAGGIRHIHGCQVDPFTDDIWITTGDVDVASRIYYNTNHFLPDSSGKIILNLLGVGSQEFRVVSMAFTEDYIYWFMDAPCVDQKIFRVRRSDSYPTLYPSTPNDSDYRELVGIIKDKPFYHNITYRDTGGTTILVGSVYEDAALYGCAFREVDDRSRIIGVKENADHSFQIQEVLSQPASQRYSTIMPVGTSSDGYIYFDAQEADGRHSVYNARYLWNNVDDISSFESDTLTVFKNAKILFHGDLTGQSRAIIGKINSRPDSGGLPIGLLSASPYYWTFCQLGENPKPGYISIALSEISGVKFGDSLTWLARYNPGDDWINIGGVTSDGAMQSTIFASSYSQFAIGSHNSIIESNRDLDELPYTFGLFQNYPNPFNPVTFIRYSLPSRAFVTLKIYDLLGRELETLVEEMQSEGVTTVKFDGGKLPSGVYIYKLQAGNYSAINKMVLIK